MDRYIVILFWILIIAVILLSTPTKCMNEKKEGFYTYNSYFKGYCSDCGSKTRYACSKCNNCGYSINASGVGHCVPGDASGSYFADDTMYWIYNDPNFYYPSSDLYPVVKTRSQYPTFRHKVHKPWKWVKQGIQVPS